VDVQRRHGDRSIVTWDFHADPSPRVYSNGVLFYDPEGNYDEGIDVTCEGSNINVYAQSQKYFDLHGEYPNQYDNYVAEVYILYPTDVLNSITADHFPGRNTLEGLGISGVRPEYTYADSQLNETYSFTDGANTIYSPPLSIKDSYNTAGDLSLSDDATVIARLVIRSREIEYNDVYIFPADGSRGHKGWDGSFRDDCDGFFSAYRPSRPSPTYNGYMITSKDRYTYITDMNLLEGIEISDTISVSTIIDNWISKKEGTWLYNEGTGTIALIGEGITNFMMLGDKFYGIDYIRNNIVYKNIKFSPDGEPQTVLFSLINKDSFTNYNYMYPETSLSGFLADSIVSSNYANFDIVDSDGRILYQWKWSLDPPQSDMIENFLTFSYIPDLKNFEFTMSENRGEDVDYKVIIYYNSSDDYGGYKIAEINLHQDKKSAILEGGGVFSPSGYGYVRLHLSPGTSIDEDSFILPDDLQDLVYKYDSSQRTATFSGGIDVKNNSANVQSRVIGVTYNQTGEKINIIANQDFCHLRFSEDKTSFRDEVGQVPLNSKLYYSLFRSYNGRENESTTVKIDSIDIVNITYTLTDKDGKHEYNTEDIFNKLSTEIVLSSSNPEETSPYIKTISEIKESYRTTKLKLTADVELAMEYTEDTYLADDMSSIQATCVNTIRIIYTIN
jgi:hypothetical protein